MDNIKERLPDTNIFSNFDILKPLKLPDTLEKMTIGKYGEKEIERLGEHYGLGDAPLHCKNWIVNVTPNLE